MQLSDIKFGEVIATTLYSDFASAAANGVANEKYNKRTQLRRFYDELVMWHDKVFHERDEAKRTALFKELEPYIQMLNAKVAYAKGRDHVDDNFAKLFSHCIKQVNSPLTLKQCKLFFEAFMCYYRTLNNK